MNMKHSCLFIFVFSFFVAALSAQEILFMAENGDFAIVFNREKLQDPTKELEISRVTIVTHERDILDMARIRVRTRERMEASCQWEVRELLTLKYASKVVDPKTIPFEYFVLEGQDIEVTLKKMLEHPCCPLEHKSLKYEVIEKDLLLARCLNEVHNKDRFLFAMKLLSAFAGELIAEAENFDREKGLPERLTRETRRYLNFDPPVWGLAPRRQE